MLAGVGGRVFIRVGVWRVVGLVRGVLVVVSHGANHPDDYPGDYSTDCSADSLPPVLRIVSGQ